MDIGEFSRQCDAGCVAGHRRTNRARARNDQQRGSSPATSSKICATIR